MAESVAEKKANIWMIEVIHNLWIPWQILKKGFADLHFTNIHLANRVGVELLKLNPPPPELMAFLPIADDDINGAPLVDDDADELDNNEDIVPLVKKDFGEQLPSILMPEDRIELYNFFSIDSSIGP